MEYFNLTIHKKWHTLTRDECMELIKTDLKRIFPKVSFCNYEYSPITMHVSEEMIWIEICFNQSPLQIRNLSPKIFEEMKKYFVEDCLDEDYIEQYKKTDRKEFTAFLTENFDKDSSNILSQYTKWPVNYTPKDFKNIIDEEIKDITRRMYNDYDLLEEKRNDDNLQHYNRALEDMERDLGWILNNPNFEMSFEFNRKKKLN